MRDTPVPIIAYIMVGLTSAVLAYVTYSDNSVPGQEKIQENTQSESNTASTSGILPIAAAAAMLPALPAFFSGKKEEPPMAEAKIIKEENEQPTDENEKQQDGEEQQLFENEIKQTGGKKTKKNKTKTNKQLHKKNKTKHRK
uniref:Uncharacterized protein n=1 Tax=viral metagenome TaxID=1070528 RepID=A0A6C0EA31_9ZZZZ